MVSSHLLSEMELMCDRVAVIQNGKLVDVQEMSELTREEGLSHVHFEVSEPLEAQNLLARQLPQVEILPAAAGFEAVVEREQIPLIIECLVKEGHRVYGVKASGKSLEDKFLEMTGSGQIA